jgi:hypothetical protein
MAGTHPVIRRIDNRCPLTVTLGMPRGSLTMPTQRLTAAALISSAAIANAQQDLKPNIVHQHGHHCLAIDPDIGDFRLTGGPISLEVDLTEYEPTGSVGAATLSPGGVWLDQRLGMLTPNPANRVDIVFVGDGYTANEINQYHTDVDNFANQMFQSEPLVTYRPLFGIHRVDVVSNESGIDNDPTQGISRDTALDMNFWCNNIERLLCVNVSKAYSHANTASIPGGGGPDQVLAVANTTKYGGAGYSSSNLGTASARNAASVEVAVHELGHSMANLADEYTYGGPTVYSGNEPGSANASIFEHADMANQNRKWHMWLGDNSPQYDGLTSTFEGASYSEIGIYRPSQNSKMRALNRPFNRVGAEAFVIEIYRIVNPIDSSSPAASNIAGHTTLSVCPVQPINHALDIQWYVDGLPVNGATTDSFNTTNLGSPGVYAITARVIDNTPLVRNESARATLMTAERQWTVTIENCLADVNNDGVVTPTDFTAWINAFNNSLPGCDQNNDGSCTATDFTAWITNFNAGC